jgi:hypothetical protein
VPSINLPDDLTPESILTRAAYADLTLELARWILRRWDHLPPFQRSAIRYALQFGGSVGDGQVTLAVPITALLEALDVLRRRSVEGRFGEE